MTCPVCKENPNADCPLCRIDALDMAARGQVIQSMDLHYAAGETAVVTEDYMLCLLRDETAVLMGCTSTAGMFHAAAALVHGIAKETDTPLTLVLTQLMLILKQSEVDNR